MKLRLAACMAIGVVVLWSFPATSQTADDKAALAGVKELKIVFDLTNGDAKSLSGTLAVIEETRESLIKQGVVPHIALAFRGGATKLVQTDQSLIAAEQRADARKIAQAIKALGSAEGIVSIEQCGIAAANQAVLPGNLLPGIKLVGNGWIALAAYQAKGFSYISP